VLDSIALAALAGGASDPAREEHFNKLRTAVEKLRTRNDALRRSEEYHLKMLQTKAEHIEVLEVALRESNGLHREQTRKHVQKVQALENEVERLKQLLATKGVSSGFSFFNSSSAQGGEGSAMANGG